jgi:KDO2-lipid IV(A) lauroyltransferase
MSRLFYYLALKPLSLLPFRVLYGVSTFLYWTLYRIAGYRTGVVRENIRRSFPEKNPAEWQRIEREFYRHFFELLAEGIKLFSLTGAELRAACTIENPEVFDPFWAQGKRVIIVSGHYGNWELASQRFAQMQIMHTRGIYSPLTNKFMDSKLRTSRGRFGMELVSRRVVKALFENPQQRPEAVLFATDQSPGNAKSAYWTTFLSQETGILFGAERYAVKYGCPVVYTRYQKTRRGHYSIQFELITADASTTPYGYVTHVHTRMLERDIRACPHLWLWTHRRWKRTRPEGVPLHPVMDSDHFPNPFSHPS